MKDKDKQEKSSKPLVIINGHKQVEDVKITVNADLINEELYAIIESPKLLSNIEKLEDEMFILEDCEIESIIIGNVDKVFSHTVKYKNLIIKKEYQY